MINKSAAIKKLAYCKKVAADWKEIAGRVGLGAATGLGVYGLSGLFDRKGKNRGWRAALSILPGVLAGTTGYDMLSRGAGKPPLPQQQPQQQTNDRAITNDRLEYIARTIGVPQDRIDNSRNNPAALAANIEEVGRTNYEQLRTARQQRPNLTSADLFNLHTLLADEPDLLKKTVGSYYDPHAYDRIEKMRKDRGIKYGSPGHVALQDEYFQPRINAYNLK